MHKAWWGLGIVLGIGLVVGCQSATSPTPTYTLTPGTITNGAMTPASATTVGVTATKITATPNQGYLGLSLF